METDRAPVDERPMTLGDKIALAVRVWRWFVVVRLRVRRTPLPDLVGQLGRPSATARRHPPRRLSRAVHRSLSIGPYQPRCLFGALVLYRLLREQGDPAELVIGLPDRPSGERAHAWVELAGRDVGPPPGRGRHSEFARFG